MFYRSINYRFSYRAVIRDSHGEILTILESNTFKSLYHCTRCEMRCNVDFKSGCYDVCSAELSFGYGIEKEIRQGYFDGEWKDIKSIGYMWVSTCSQGLIRYSDGKEYLL